MRFHKINDLFADDVRVIVCDSKQVFFDGCGYELAVKFDPLYFNRFVHGFNINSDFSCIVVILEDCGENY